MAGVRGAGWGRIYNYKGSIEVTLVASSVLKSRGSGCTGCSRRRATLTP